jgi:hypothetical protein
MNLILVEKKLLGTDGCFSKIDLEACGQLYSHQFTRKS